jgi:endonuclease-3
MTQKERFSAVIAWFQENMPVAETELHYRTHYELLVAVILSAQCTDKRVNSITPPFFEKYPDSKALAEASVESIFEMIKSCSYPNNKAKNLLGMAKTLQDQYGGVVPDTRGELMKLPGAGRKTANVMLSVAFGKPAFAVDTHVFRVAARIGLSSNAKNPLETEKQLTRYIPEELQSIAHHWLILHGRYVCLARKPKCESCGLSGVCVYFKQKRNSATPPQ